MSREIEGRAIMAASIHQLEPGGGCTCGFCVWSVEHVIVMTIREVVPDVKDGRR